MGIMGILVVILGILVLVGAISCYLIDRKRKSQLKALRREKADLSAKLAKAEEEKADSETQLSEARTEISNLTEQLNEARTEISNLTEQLNEARTEISSLTGQLDEANRQIRTLKTQLSEARTEISSLTGQLDEARTEISNLTEQLDEARTEISSRTTQLSEVSASNENALKLLHLFEVSLQLTAFALYSEMSRAKRLGVENRKFDAAYKNLRGVYEDLHAEYKAIFDDYADLREKIDRKAKGRLVRSGVGVVLSLIPGVGLLQLAADLIELVDFASDLSENTADFCTLLSAAELYITSSSVWEDFDAYKSIKSLQPDISSDQDREKVEQESQTVFKEAFMENLAQDDKEPDASDFDHFLMAIIQRMENLVASVPEGARRNARRGIVDKFRPFGVLSYTYHESSEAPADKSLSPPTN